MPARTACPRIADRAEFVDALTWLRRGHVLVRIGDDPHGVTIDGAVVRHAFAPLLHYGLIDEFRNAEGFAGVRYYRLTPRGRDFATRVGSAWRRRPLWQRVVVRLIG